MKATNNILILLFSLLCASCSQPSLTGDELIQWMENKENKLRQTKIENDVTYILQYKSLDYVLAKKNGIVNNPEYNKSDLSNEMADKLLFDLFITCEGGKSSPLQYRAMNEDEVNERFYYYHFRFVDAIHIESDDKKIAPLYCITDKGSGLNNTISFSIGFDKKQVENNDFKLVVNDKFLGSGTVKFLFKDSYLSKLPKLKNNI